MSVEAVTLVGLLCFFCRFEVFVNVNWCSGSRSCRCHGRVLVERFKLQFFLRKPQFRRPGIGCYSIRCCGYFILFRRC